MKDAFNDEQALKAKLDRYEVSVPTARLLKKRSRFEQLLHYLASPTRDPLAPVTSSYCSLLLLKVAAVPAVLLLALLQGLLL